MRNAPVDSHERPSGWLADRISLCRGTAAKAMNRCKLRASARFYRAASPAPFSLVLIPRFRFRNQIWFPYAQPVGTDHNLKEVCYLRSLFGKPTRIRITVSAAIGIIWARRSVGFLYLQSLEQSNVFLPLTWKRVRGAGFARMRAIRQLLGLYPIKPHRRVLSHLILMEFYCTLPCRTNTGSIRRCGSWSNGAGIMVF